MQMQQIAIAPAITLNEMVALAFRQRAKIIAALIIPPLLAGLALLVLSPTYRAQTDLVVKTGREYLAQGEGEQAMSAPTATKQEGINSEIELLTSRPVIEATINKIGLANLYPKLIEDPPWFDSVMDVAVRRLTHAIDVQPIKLSNVISVTMEADSPAEAARLLDQLIAVYQAKHAEVYAGGRSPTYKLAVDRALSELDRLEARRTEIKLGNRIYDITQQRASLITQQSEAKNHLQDVINNKATLEKRVTFLTDMRAQVPATARTVDAEKSDEMVHARETLMDLRQAEASLSARYSAGNPDLQRVRDQIKALQSHSSGLKDQFTRVTLAPSPLAQQIDQELVMDRAELAPIDAEIARYQALLVTLAGELHRIEGADLELRTIDARAVALNANLAALQSRYDVARTEDEMDRARIVSVVQVAKAIAPDKAASPKPLLFIGAGILLGVIAAGGVVVMSLITNRTFITEAGVERVLGVPVLVAVPFIPGGRKSSQLLLE